MALWQFQMLMVPRELIGDNRHFTGDEVNEIEWWNLRQPPTDYIEQFAAVLPKANCPFDGGAWWGTSAGKNIEVFTNDNAVEDIIIRVDCRNFDPAFSLRMLDIANAWDCGLIYRRYFTVMPVDNREYIDAIMKSPNRQFMANPDTIGYRSSLPRPPNAKKRHNHAVNGSRR